ncbi:hypothetical protein [Streptomyces sp. NBC_00576]|uniref:hypothetical protein n=1 Tax=Streptomyces sp. NBC_00576 TaxID=2903665 RepID=UPI002E7FE223|nr:hypothetical protein [Streptomyces sp. NBC_00576]
MLSGTCERGADWLCWSVRTAAGEAEPGDQLPQFLDLPSLVRDGLLELDHGLAQLALRLGDLLRFGAYPLIEFVLQIRVPLHQRHAVDVGLDGEGRDGETPGGGGGLPGQEAVHGLADARALVGGLLGHLKTLAVSAVAAWVTAAWRSRAALARSRLPMWLGACAASWSISSARSRS